MIVGIFFYMKTYPTEDISIKKWALEDRPRERFLKLGKKEMSNTELLAILIGSGTSRASAMTLAKKLLIHFDERLELISSASVEEICSINGFGKTTAIKLQSALELGYRATLNKSKPSLKIGNSHQVYALIKDKFYQLPHEEFWVVYLNRSNRVIGMDRTSKGGVSGTLVDPRIIFKAAVQKLASSIILVHNHPSGNLNASRADIELTRKLISAGKQLDIAVLDHLIITDEKYLSFADEGMI